jgi:meso-butanediol dehydrogenase / (S,S)-butanediol dehydrogenase / diacetyl reductase
VTDLSGRVAFITGTAGGIGRASALAFAAAGARVVGCDIQRDADLETVELVRAAGGEMQSVAPLDLTTVDGADEWAARAAAVYDGVDILFNNASSQWVGPFEEMTPDDWYFTITHELHIVYLCTRAVWPHLIAGGGGVVLNVASVSATRGAQFVHQAAHGAAKGGVLAFTKHLCVSGAEHGIRANAISPGLIRTPATKRFVDDPDSGVPEMTAILPSRRVGRPEDIAAVAAFLACDEASFINGANIPVDGGVTAIA